MADKEKPLTDIEKEWMLHTPFANLNELTSKLNFQFGRNFSPGTIKSFRVRSGIAISRGIKGERRYPPGEKMTNQGYRMVRQDGRLISKHRIEWERLNGCLPSDMVLICKGDRSNCDPSNWIAVDSKLRNYLTKNEYKISDLPSELHETAIAIAKLKSIMKGRTRDDEPTQPPSSGDRQRA